MIPFTQEELSLLITEIETASGETIFPLKFQNKGLYEIMHWWMWYTRKQVQKIVSHFMSFPPEDMPLYLIPDPILPMLTPGTLMTPTGIRPQWPHKIRNNIREQCPTYSERVLPWQTVLARWRIRIKK